MKSPQKILEGIYLIGSEELSGSGDCLVYGLAIGKNQICLIDAGTNNADQILENISHTDLAGRTPAYLILTHCHFDHIGAAHQFQQKFPKIQIIAHNWDAAAIQGMPNTENLTAASWYGRKLIPVTIFKIIQKDREVLNFQDTKLEVFHCPGHTPGSIAILFKHSNGQKILFGQDIHGPFMSEFNSNLTDWAASMKLLRSLNADILCEGHYGVFKGSSTVKKFIDNQLKINGF
jgi:glyoxylase-like metal-dependent hydrolase (beta-lactamase superfamily II)